VTQQNGPNPSPTDAPQGSSFDRFALPESVGAGLADAGFTHYTPIQEGVLPLSLAGRDVAGQAQTGTGKTAVFLVALFTRLLASGRPGVAGAPRALVIAPTRELVVQIAADAAVYGGVDYRKQRDRLEETLDILIGTPGRLIDYLKQRVYRLDRIEALVIDEADRMFDMGFIRDRRFLLRRLPRIDRRQSMLFSATSSWDVMELVYEFMNDPERVTVTPEQVTAANVEHHVLHVGNDEKLGMMLGLLRRDAGSRTVVFTNMKRTAEDLVDNLRANGFDAGAITGDIDQRRRLQLLADFKEGRLLMLVATDAASRGLHIGGVTHVITTTCRRTPRTTCTASAAPRGAGASGRAISLVCEDYAESLEAIERFIGFKLPYEIPDHDLFVAPTDVRRRRTRGTGAPAAQSIRAVASIDAAHPQRMPLQVAPTSPARRRGRGSVDVAAAPLTPSRSAAQDASLTPVAIRASTPERRVRQRAQLMHTRNTRVTAFSMRPI